MAQHACIVEKGSNFLAPSERNFASPKEQPSSCGTGDCLTWDPLVEKQEHRQLKNKNSLSAIAHSIHIRLRYLDSK